MIVWLLLVSQTLAGGPSLVRPSPPDPAPNECLQSVPITKGEPIPAALLSGGVAACSSVAEPTSSLAYLLAIEKYERATDKLHALDIELLETQSDWYKARYEQAVEPPKWIEKPTTQRWIGRLEMLATVAVVAGGVSAAYYYGTGGQK